MALVSNRPMVLDPEPPVAPPRTGRRRPRRRLPLSIVVAIALLLLAEGSVRLVASSIAQPLEWGDWETQNKVAAMDTLSRHGGASTVFVGSSMMNADLDPHAFDDLASPARPSFNAALNGSDPRTLKTWVLNVVVPRLRPETVVIGLSSRDVNDNGRNQQTFFNSFTTSPKGAEATGHESVVDRVTNVADDVSYLVRYRTVLRNPANLTKDKHGPNGDRADRLGVLPSVTDNLDDPYEYNGDFRTAQLQQVLNDYVVGPKETAAIEDLIEGLQARNVRVVIVKMPITADVLPMHPNGAADYDRFSRVLDGIVARPGVDYVDAGETIHDPAMFKDPYHANREGRKAFTTLMAKRVKAGP